MSVRVHDLSKQLNMENKELITLLKDRGFVVKSPSSTVDNISAEALLKEFGVAAAPSSTAAEVPAKPIEPPGPKYPPPPPPAPPPPPPVVRAGPGSPPPLPRSFQAQPRPPAPKPPGFTVAQPHQPARPSQAVSPMSSVSRPPPVPATRPPSSPPPPTRSSPPAPPSQPKPLPTQVKSAPSLPKTDTATPATDGVAPPSGDGKIVQIKPPIIVRDFAVVLGLRPFRLIQELMEMGIFSGMNQAVEEEVAVRLAKKHGFTLEIKHRGEQQPAPVRKPEPEPVDESKFLEPRPAIVCVLGHVNHGKTTLLDAIRKSNVVAGEAGGITQHTGAYQIDHNNHKITFLDTPGHAAFSKMRERGANLTDIAVLVVAADDSFMPQTEEALAFAQKAGVPVVVAINKVDAKGANVERVKQSMQQHGIAPEEWGGETLCEPISALKGQGVEKLLDSLLLQAEMLELRANPKCPAEGIVVDSQVEIGRGSTAMVIVQKGTLKAGDALVCGTHYCKVRGMVDDRNKPMKAATPGTPARILGWSDAPEAGAKFHAVKNERTAKAEAEAAALESRQVSLAADAPERVQDIDALLRAIHETKQKVFRCIVKGDVHGGVEALAACLLDIKSDKVSLEVVASGVGPIDQNDILMAGAAQAGVVGFNVKMENGVASLAKHKGVQIIQHDIIYELINRVREAMAELLDPELRENKIGAAEVRQVFPLAKGFVAGCMVTEGRVTRDGHARLMRKDKVIFTGQIGTLKRFKDDASEVRAGYECGLRLDGCDDYQPGDVIECFEILQIKPSL